MALVNEVENGLTGQAGYNAPQTLAPADFTATAAEGAGTLFPTAPTVSVSAAMNQAGDQDYFALALGAGQRVLLDIDAAAVAPDLTLYVYRPDGALFTSIPGASFVDPGSFGLADPLGEFTTSVAGLWRIGVQVDAQNQTGAYRLNVSLLDAPTLYWGSAGPDTADGGEGADTLSGYAPGTAATEAGADLITGAGGDDLLRGGGGADTLDGGDENDSLEGGGGPDSLRGGTGNDTLDGGDGNDSMLGMDGDDLLRGGNGADTLVGIEGADTLDGGAGDDLLEGFDFTDLLLGAAGNDTLRGWASADTLRGSIGNDLLEGMDSHDRLEGGDGADTIWGAASDGGASGRDTMIGGAGDDLITGGALADRALGGAGNDTLKGSFGRDVLIGNIGDDLIFDAAGFEEVDADADMVDGGAGSDTLQGGWNDRLLGGDGNDRLGVQIYTPSSLHALPFADGGTGFDTLVFHAGLAANIGGLLLDARSAFGRIELLNSVLGLSDLRWQTGVFLNFEVLFAIGTAGARDTLMGGAGADTLYTGGGSDDLLLGGGGADLLAARAQPGAVSDASESSPGVQLLGGAGDDRLVFEGVPDLVAATSGFGDGGDGADSLFAADGVGDLYLSGGTGADTIRVEGGSVVADGGTGDDILVIAQPAAGAMVVEYYGLGEGWARAATFPDGPLDGLGVDFSGFERLLLIGSISNDSLQGGEGSDTLNGGIGADRLEGGLGNDLLVVDDALDVVLDAGGADTVQASISWTLGGSFEALALVGGAESLAGRGHGGANTLAGSAGANSLAGLGGNDSLSGGAGADTLDGGAAADTLRGGSEFDVFVLRLGEAQGDRILDFAGNGAGAGDVIRFVGYGAGAAATLVSGTTWQVQGANGSNTFTIIGSFTPNTNDDVFA